MKTLKVEAVYPMAYETFADVANDLPKIHRQGLQRSSSPLSAGLSQPAAVRGSQSPAYGQISRLTLVRPKGPTPPGGASFTGGNHGNCDECWNSENSFAHAAKSRTFSGRFAA